MSIVSLIDNFVLIIVGKLNQVKTRIALDRSQVPNSRLAESPSP